MAYFKLLIISLCLFWSQAHAGYAQLKPPPGWVPSSVPGTAGKFNFGKAANNSNVNGGTVATDAGLNIGGRLITVPVGARIAANAANVASGFIFANPWVAAAAAAGSILYDWYKLQGLDVQNGQWVEKDPTICTVSPCYGWAVKNFPTTVSSTKFEAAQKYCSMNKYPAAVYSPNIFGYLGPGWLCGNNYSMVEATGFVQATVPPAPSAYKPVTEDRFHEIMDYVPVPDSLPKQLPQVDWPVEAPVINPDPA